MLTSKQKNKKRQYRVIIAATALVFTAGWAVIGILSLLSILQSVWLSITSLIFAAIGIAVALFQWLFPVTNDQVSNDDGMLLDPYNLPTEAYMAPPYPRRTLPDDEM